MTRSWQVHIPSKATTSKERPKENSKNEPKVKVKKPTESTGTRPKYYDLPPESFVYGLANKPHTPIKDIINNEFANKAEQEVKKSYENFFEEKAKIKKLVIKKTPHLKKLLELKKEGNSNNKDYDKPLYKLKMFQDVGSKVAEGIKQFKTYKGNKKECNTGLNNVIQQVQEEIKKNEQC